jgi:excisionase family DNA binding protein
MDEEVYKETLEDWVLGIADKLKGHDYKSVLDRELKEIEAPEIPDIKRGFKAVLEHFEEGEKDDLQEKEPTTDSHLSKEDTWLTRKEACEKIKVSLSTFKRMIDDGNVPEYGTGRIKRYKASEVDASFQKMLGSCVPTLCKEGIRYFDRKDFKIITFEKDKKYDIIYENSIWVYIYNREWMNSLKLSKKQFRRHFSVEDEMEFDAAKFKI